MSMHRLTEDRQLFSDFISTCVLQAAAVVTLGLCDNQMFGEHEQYSFV